MAYFNLSIVRIVDYTGNTCPLILSEIEVSIDGGISALTPSLDGNDLAVPVPDSGAVVDLLNGSLAGSVSWSDTENLYINLQFDVDVGFDLSSALVYIRQGAGSDYTKQIACCRIQAWTSGTNNDVSTDYLHFGALALANANNTFSAWLGCTGWYNGANPRHEVLYYKDNFSVLITEVKVVNQEYFNVDPYNHPFGGLGMTPGFNCLGSNFFVPMTLLAPDGVTVRASGYVVGFNSLEDYLAERVYLDSSLAAIDFAVGDTLSCRMRSEDYRKYAAGGAQFFTQPSPYMQDEYGFEVDVAASLVEILYSAGVTAGNDIILPGLVYAGVAPRPITFILYDGGLGQPSISFSLSGYDNLEWVGGTPPAFNGVQSSVLVRLTPCKHGSSGPMWAGEWSIPGA